MAKPADFTINGTAQATLGYDAENGETLTLALENAPAIDVWKLEFQIVIASKDAPDLVVSPDPMVRFQPPWSATVTMPAEGAHSYQIRSAINGGVDANGRYRDDYYAERIVCTRSAIGRRKILPGESTQYSATGWSDEQNRDVDAMTEASGVQPSRKITAGNGLQGGGTLEADRTISVKPHADGSIVADADGTKVGVISDAQHGTRGGGTLHAVAEGGATPKDGFMSGEDKTTFDAIAAAFATMPAASYDPTPGTLARRLASGGSDPGGSLRMVDAIVTGDVRAAGGGSFGAPVAGVDGTEPSHLATLHQLEDYVLWADVDVSATPDKVVARDGSGNINAVNATCSGTATITGSCTAGSLVSSSLSHASADLLIGASGSGKAVVINGAGGAFLRHNGANIAATTASSLLLFRSAVFDGTFNGTFGFLAAGSTPGKTVTVAGQSVTTGTGGAAIIQAGTGSVANGEVQLAGDVIRGLSKEWAWMAPDTYTKASISTADGAAITAKSIKLQVNDATTPATVRTPFEITRGVDASGKDDIGTFTGGIAVYEPAAGVDLMNVQSEFFKVYLDGSGGILGDRDSGRWEATGAWIFYQTLHIGSDRYAMSGQLCATDGEILNAKGSTGAEACLVSYDVDGTAIFGSDKAGARTADKAILAGATSAQIVAAGVSVAEANSAQFKMTDAQFCVAVVESPIVTATTKTFNGQLGNVHTAAFSSTSACTVSLSNTKKGAEMEMFFSKSGSGVGVLLSSTWFSWEYFTSGSTPSTNFATAGKMYIRGRVHADGGKLMITEFRNL